MPEHSICHLTPHTIAPDECPPDAARVADPGVRSPAGVLHDAPTPIQPHPTPPARPSLGVRGRVRLRVVDDPGQPGVGIRQARGRTLELGAGTGFNLRWYPGDVELVAVDLDRERLEVWAERAHELGRAVRLLVADGHRLPFGDDTFDTVVCTLAICDVDDRAATIAEAYRVVRPGGLLLLLDHLEPRWRHGRPATLGERVGFTVVERQCLWAGYFERVRLEKPGK